MDLRIITSSIKSQKGVTLTRSCSGFIYQSAIVGHNRQVTANLVQILKLIKAHCMIFIEIFLLV